MVNSFLAGLTAAVLPHYCVLCGLRSDRDHALCTGCEGDLPSNDTACPRCALPLNVLAATGIPCGHCQIQPPPFGRAIAPWVYDEHLAHLVHRWKFRGERHLTSVFARLWHDAAGAPPPVDIIAPVPLHWLRRWRRGYNQSALLAEALCKLSDSAGGNARFEPQLLRRTRATRAQSGMSAGERRHNLVGAFTVRRPCDNLRVALVDDVMTTTATATEVARVLKRAGARDVQVWCLARTPSPGG